MFAASGTVTPRPTHDATFMRMKEDHMKNGQLKPGYNVNVATCCEYIIGSYISPDCTDTKTLIPFMNQLRVYPEDMRLRRFLLRGNVKVEAEWTLIAIAYNILKLFHKMTTGRLGTCLAVPTSFLEDSA